MSGYIKFELLPKPRSYRTQVWVIRSTGSGAMLGEVRWRSNWRQYALYPAPNTVFEEDCLREIADFVEIETRNRHVERVAEAVGKGKKALEAA